MRDEALAEAWVQYRRTAIAEMADWHHGFDMTGVSVSEVDAQNGSPREGDKIARNPKNHADKWLVAAAYFAENFEAAGRAEAPDAGEEALRDSVFDVVNGHRFDGDVFPCVDELVALIAYRERRWVEAARIAVPNGDGYCPSCGERWDVSMEMGACKLHPLWAALRALSERSDG